MIQPRLSHRCPLLYAVLIGLFFLSLKGPSSVAAQSITWDRLADGLAVGVWNPILSCDEVSPLVVTVIDPTQYRFVVHYYRNEPLTDPPDIHEWQAKTGHDVVFNAGLFRENFAYLGLLYGQGKPLGGKRHPSWMGLFVAEPTRNGHPAGILDLAIDAFDEQQPGYTEAAQSLMLLDRTGKVRVKQTGKQSQQTIVAEQHDGRILVLKTTSPVSLHAIGECLHIAYPAVRQAMAMDGGSSSDIAISPVLHQAIEKVAGARSWMSLLNAGTTGHIGLPAVIGVSPRQSSTGR